MKQSFGNQLRTSSTLIHVDRQYDFPTEPRLIFEAIP